MNKRSNKYYFKNDEFVIEDYDKQKTFASFLPGLAGINGIPMWCHYLNRAQVISSFGIRDKDGSILEFYPANTAYRIIDKMGFRTFIKIHNLVYEPFSLSNTSSKRTMYIRANDIRIEEINYENQIKIEVSYFGLAQTNIPGLVRNVKVTNLGSSKNIEIIDGITQLLPSNINEWMLKHQSNLLKSWVDVKLLKEKIAYYIVNSIPVDEAEVSETTMGNYYISIFNEEVIKPIYDANIIFGNDTTFTRPLNFELTSISSLSNQPNITANKVPVGFTPLEVRLDTGHEITWHTVIGQVANENLIIEKATTFCQKSYFEKALLNARETIDVLTKDVETHTSNSLFDEYMKQNYLDNMLRGGYPYSIDTSHKHFIYHLFSRRHGDMEREYNYFVLEPEYYSQGNGNFRDVCQNRRSDCLFHPEVGIYNVKYFANLIQLDGYNPLGVLGSTFIIEDYSIIEPLCRKLFPKDVGNYMFRLLQKPFTPGKIVTTMEHNGITSLYSLEEIFEAIFDNATQEIKAEFGEGYWSDHWTYILDLVESTMAIYPDNKNEYLFKDESYAFFESPVYVLPRSEKYCLTKTGKIRQFGSLLINDQTKISKMNLQSGTNWSKLPDGTILKTSLFGKLFTLVVNKFVLLDSDGIGIETEANKPGWNDAMNGVPGVFGSGVSETIELLRLVNFLLTCNGSFNIKLPSELIELISKTKMIYRKNLSSFETWKEVANLREEYRANTRYGCQEKVLLILLNELIDYLEFMRKVLIDGLDKAKTLGNGLYPTFIMHNVTSYKELDHIGNYNLPTIEVNNFESVLLPPFLEAPARYYKLNPPINDARKLYKLVKNSDLYDKLLKMYKTSVDLDDWNYDIGRIRAFQKGWLERESNFLHMTYKYLLGLLKCGLYKEFYTEFWENVVCFRNPEEYGRSILENSSFIAPSNNPDPAVWGQGFVARLSGSTAEMLNMWHIMMFGEFPFKLISNKLYLEFNPILDKKLFDEHDLITTTFLSKIQVEYYNPQRVNTFDDDVIIKKVTIDGIDLPTPVIFGNIAKDIRNGKVKNIRIELGTR